MYDLISDIEVQGNLLIVKLFSLNFVFLSKSFFVVESQFGLLSFKFKSYKKENCLDSANFSFENVLCFFLEDISSGLQSGSGFDPYLAIGRFFGEGWIWFQSKPIDTDYIRSYRKKNMAEILSGRNFVLKSGFSLWSRGIYYAKQ